MKEVSLKNIINITDRLHNLVSQLHDEATPNRFLALFDLTRKMRASLYPERTALLKEIINRSSMRHTIIKQED